MILSPAKITIEDSTKIKGVVLDGEYLTKVIDLIERSTVNGLKGEDAVLLMKLRMARQELSTPGISTI